HTRRCKPAILALAHRVEGLRRDPQAVRPARADPFADIRLAAATAVRVGRVEPRDSGLPGGVHELDRLLERLPFLVRLRRGADAAEVATTEDQAPVRLRRTAHGP